MPCAGSGGRDGGTAMRARERQPERRERLSDAQWATALANRHAARSLRAAHGHYTGRFSGAQWLAKVRAAGYRCFYCGQKLPLRRLTVDHIWPVSQPGSRNDIFSVLVACARCNHQRGNRPLADYLAWRAAQDGPRPTRPTPPAPRHGTSGTQRTTTGRSTERRPPHDR